MLCQSFGSERRKGFTISARFWVSIALQGSARSVVQTPLSAREQDASSLGCRGDQRMHPTLYPAATFGWDGWVKKRGFVQDALSSFMHQLVRENENEERYYLHLNASEEGRWSLKDRSRFAP